MYLSLEPYCGPVLPIKIERSEKEKKEREEEFKKLILECGDYSESSDTHSNEDSDEEGEDKEKNKYISEVCQKKSRLDDNSKNLSKAITVFRYDINNANSKYIMKK